MARIKTKPKPVVEQMDLLAPEVIERASPALQSAAFAPPPVDDAEPTASVETTEPDRGPFGAWLVQQQSNRREWVAGLARTAKADHRFPKRGTVDDVRKYLTGLGADGDAFEALDDAEMDWLGL